MRMIQIYAIRNTVNEKYYVGQTSQGHTKRLTQHKYRAKADDRPNGGCPKLYNAMRKHGIDKFYIELLDTVPEEVANDKETEYIKKYDAFTKGYNTLEYGESRRGFTHSPETLRKMSESNKGRIMSKESLDKRRKTFVNKDKKKIICLEDKTIYKNKHHLAETLNMRPDNIQQKLSTLQSKINNKKYMYLEDFNKSVKALKEEAVNLENQVIKEVTESLKEEGTDVKLDKKLLAIALRYG